MADIDTTGITDQLIAFIKNISGLDVNTIVRAYPWINIERIPFPAVVVKPPSIAITGEPIRGLEYTISYSIYYIIRITDHAAGNPHRDAEEALNTMINAFWDNPDIGNRDLVSFSIAQVSQENELNTWSLNFRQPFVSFEIILTIRDEVEKAL